MNSAKKVLRTWLLPEGFQHCVSRLKKSYRLKARKALPNAFQPEEFKDAHKGKRCFIIATGPSLQGMDLSALRDEITIGVSFLFLHPEIQKIQPKYHVIAPNHSPFDFELVERYLNGLTNCGSRIPAVFYGDIPYQYSVGEYLKKNPSLPISDRLRLIDYSCSAPLSESNINDPASWSLAATPFLPRTVLYGAIQLAYHLGISQIYLLGCDHNYLTELSRKPTHFYAESKGNPKDEEHLAEFSTERWFREYYLRWRDYRLMQDYLKPRGTEIINATVGGMLDVFPRVEFSSIV